MSAGGVEKNAESRFVDYTISSPYEELIADIEKLIKEWDKLNSGGGRIDTTVVYEGTEFNVSTFNKQMNRDIATVFWQWFGATDFMLLSTVNSVAYSGEAEILKRVAYSALVTALDSTKSKLPGFVVICPLSLLSTTSRDDILGYCIVPPNCHMNKALQPNDVKYTVTQYESSVAPSAISPKHELFYIDGLRNLYNQKLRIFSLQDVESLSDTDTELTSTNVAIKEQYRYVLPPRVLLPISPVSMHTLPIADKTSLDDEVAVESLSINNPQSSNVSTMADGEDNEELAVYGDEMEDYEGALFHDVVTSNRSPESQDYLLNRCSGFPRSRRLQWLRDRRARCSDSMHGLIHEVIVNLQYGGSEASPTQPPSSHSADDACDVTGGMPLLSSNRLVDNEYYTTLFPSQQPVSAWSMDIVLTEDAMVDPSATTSGAATRTLSRFDRKSMAGCLRRLLALYICGKCCTNMTVSLISALEPGILPHGLPRNVPLGSVPTATITNRGRLEEIHPHSHHNGISTVTSSTRGAMPTQKAGEFVNAASGVPSSPAQLLERYLDVEKCNTLAVVLSTESQHTMTRFCSLVVDKEVSLNVSSSSSIGARRSSVSASSPRNSQRNIPPTNIPTTKSVGGSSTVNSPVLASPTPSTSSSRGQVFPHITLAERLFDTPLQADSPNVSGQDLPTLFNLPPLHHMVSLLSVYLGHSSHDTLAGVAVFWSSWCAQLRLHWEEGVPLPHMIPSDAHNGIDEKGHVKVHPANVFLSCPPSFCPQSSRLTQDASGEHAGSGPDTAHSNGHEFGSLGESLPSSWYCNNTLLNMHQSYGGDDAYGIPCFPKEPRGLPIPTQTLICQKLQMIDICILFKDDDMIWQPSHNGTPKGKKSRKTLDSMAEEDADEFFDAQDVVPRRPLASAQPSNTTAHTSSDIKDNDASTIQCPPLLRRLPMTSDGWKSQVKLLAKMGAADEARKSLATEGTDDIHTSLSYKTLLVEWQLRMPHVVSDIKSFKAVNKSASIDDFISWYFPSESKAKTLAKDDLIRFAESALLMERSCRDIWKLLSVLAEDGCGGIPAIEQKPLFRPEQEAEKAMSYLESLTPFQIASCLLPNAMVAALEMLQCQCQLAGHLEEEIIRSDLKLLKETIEVALEQLALDTPQDQYFQYNSPSRTRTATVEDGRLEGNGPVRAVSENPILQEGHVNQQVLMAIDAVCGLTDHLERLNDSLTEVTALLPSAASGNVHSLSTSPVRQLIVSLCRSHHAQAKTLEESKELFTLAKQISRRDAAVGAGASILIHRQQQLVYQQQQQQQVNHMWHSTDGRELGVPWKKYIQFTTTFTSPIPQVGSLFSNYPVPSLEYGEYGEYSLDDEDTQVQQSMCAVLIDNTLRVNFKLCEVEC